MCDDIRDAASYTDDIPMCSHYFLTSKECGKSFLKKKLTSTVFKGNLRMTRSYNRHGRERDKVVKATCDAAVEEVVLRTMRQEHIDKLPDSYNPMKLTNDHPSRGEERKRIESEHIKQIGMQWRRFAEASRLRATRRHFAQLIEKMTTTGRIATAMEG